jgi:4-amino-4-deoxy-L-arabinose transferase-like glycosyltransferase
MANNCFALLAYAVFFTLLLATMVQQGLFMDGLIYSAVSHNMANGIGTFWTPVFSATTLNPFYEHPPLALGMQSVFFKIFGHSFWVEKMYSLLMAVAMLVLIQKVWKEANASNAAMRKGWWMPVILWITVPICFWCYRNNMLENTMSLFSMLAFYVVFKQRHNQQIISVYHLLAGVLVFFGFLSKGFPAMFPLAAPFIIALCSHSVSKAKGLYLSALTALGFLLVATLFYFTTGFADNFKNYLQVQVTPSLTGQTVVGRRTILLEVLAMQVLAHAALVLIIYVLYKKIVKQKNDLSNTERGMATMFLLVGLSALLPMLISPKQLGFYIMPSLAYFSLALSIWLLPKVMQLAECAKNWKHIKRFRISLASFIVVPFLVAAIFFGKISRDKNHLPDVFTIGQVLGMHATISASKVLYPDWRLMGYFQRFYFIAFDRSGKELEYIILKKEEPIPANYQQMQLDLISLKLAKKQS